MAWPAPFSEKLSEKTQRLSLFYYSALKHLGELPLTGPLSVLDIGSRHFAYAPGLAAYLCEASTQFELTGLELDPYRLYYDFYRRGDLGRYYAEISNEMFGPLGRVNYQQGDFVNYEAGAGRLSLITYFFPFLFRDLHRKFGLPSQTFAPEKHYQKALELSSHLILFHQGELELEASKNIISRISAVKIEREIEVTENPWLQRKFKVYALLVRSFKELKSSSKQHPLIS